jgi:hypothetical protein
MQPLPFIFIQPTIQQDIFANPQAPAAHFCFQSAVQLLQPDFRKSVFRKAGKPRIAPRIYCAKITARRNRSESVFPNEVRWKNLLRHLRIPQPAGSCSELCPAFHMLELAKGFEPPTP